MPEELKKARELAAAIAGAASQQSQTMPPPAPIAMKPVATLNSAPAVETKAQEEEGKKPNTNGTIGAEKNAPPQRTVVVEKPAIPAFVPKTTKEEYQNKAEAKAAFMELLDDASIPIDFSWEKCMTRIAIDARYGARNSLGEKKQCFHEYLDKKKIQIKEENR